MFQNKKKLLVINLSSKKFFCPDLPPAPQGWKSLPSPTEKESAVEDN